MNDVKIGRGTLNQFQAEYREINDKDNWKVLASNLFPIMNQGTNMCEEDQAIYEWVIYYFYSSITQKETKDSKVKIDLTNDDVNKMEIKIK